MQVPHFAVLRRELLQSHAHPLLQTSGWWAEIMLRFGVPDASALWTQVLRVCRERRVRRPPSTEGAGRGGGELPAAEGAAGA